MSLSQPILPNKVTVYRRTRSAVWQARIKLKTGGWHRATTGKHDFEEAKERALELYYEMNAREKTGLPQVSRRFSQVAKLAIKKMEDELANGYGKSVYRSYIQALDNVLIPYFGKYHIDNITPKIMREFDVWRKKHYKKAPAASTVTTHNSALNRVFDAAVQRGWMQQTAVPTLSNVGHKGDVRPAFSFEEYRQLVKHLRNWDKAAHRGRSKMMRELLRDYGLMLANTGMRHGTESLNLKWRDLSWWYDKKGVRYLQLRVDGKTGERTLIARHDCVLYFSRIAKRFDEFKGKTIEQIVEQRVDQYVFRLSDGTRTNNLHQTFRACLKEHDLLYGSASSKRRSLYSLRHMYATWELWRGRNIHQLAIQMGTSVGMLEQHYSKLTPLLLADKFGGYDFETSKKGISSSDE